MDKMDENQKMFFEQKFKLPRDRNKVIDIETMMDLMNRPDNERLECMEKLEKQQNEEIKNNPELALFYFLENAWEELDLYFFFKPCDIYYEYKDNIKHTIIQYRLYKINDGYIIIEDMLNRRFKLQEITEFLEDEINKYRNNGSTWIEAVTLCVKNNVSKLTYFNTLEEAEKWIESDINIISNLHGIKMIKTTTVH